MKFTVDSRKYYKRSKKLRNMEKGIQYQLQGWTGRTVKRIIRNISGPILKTRSGHLRRSISGRTFGGKIVKAIIGSGIFGRRPVKYARIQEKGGTIRPKKAKYLTVPFPGIKGRAANYPNTFVLKSKAGNLLIVQRQGKSGFKPLFSLKSKVTIPASHFLSESIDQMRPDLRRSLKPEAILRAMDKVKA